MLIFADALARYIFKQSFIGSEEIILFIAFWLYFIGSMYAARKDTHISANMISMFVNNQKIVKIVELLKNILSLLMTIIITVWCFRYVSWSFNMNARSNVFKLPNLIGQVPIFLSFFVWNFYALRDVIKSLYNLKNDEKSTNCPNDVEEGGLNV